MSSRLKPHHIVRIIGVGVALFTFGSYLAPFVFEFDEASDVTRKVFGNVPAGLKLAFYHDPHADRLRRLGRLVWVARPGIGPNDAHHPEERQKRRAGGFRPNNLHTDLL